MSVWQANKGIFWEWMDIVVKNLKNMTKIWDESRLPYQIFQIHCPGLAMSKMYGVCLPQQVKNYIHGKGVQ